MAVPLLKTKLYTPPLQPSTVPRPRLIERLNDGLRAGCRLTLVSAPTGFGKTTLISSWLRGLDRPAAWLCFDRPSFSPSQRGTSGSLWTKADRWQSFCRPLKSG
jgi:LuxR family maltose regulon positive regulatory protein